jgi:hypothetical protein
MRASTVPRSASISKRGRRHSSEMTVVLLLCLPSIVGTSGIGILVWLAGRGVDFAPNSVGAVLESWGSWLFVMAAYGPALLIPGLPLALHVVRGSGLRSKSGVTLWSVVSFALIAAAIFYRRLMWIAPLP